MNRRTAHGSNMPHPPRFSAILMAASAALLLSAVLSTSASADARSMIGSIHVENPSTAGSMEMQPGVYGKKLGGAGELTYAPTAGVPTVEAVGTTAGTFIGRGISVAQSQLNRTGMEFRDFPAFANVGQVSKSFMTIQNAATFAANQGALALCPGPGCTAAGLGNDINFCPPSVHDPLDPAPGTALAQIGNWDCPGFGAAGVGNRRLRMTISNVSARPNFGGTFNLIRSHLMNVWRVADGGQPSTPNAPDAQVTRSVMNFVGAPWTGGIPNFDFTNVTGTRGPLLLAQLNGNGAVAQTFGCVNGVGTNGGDYVNGQPNLNLGSNCGTDLVNVIAPGQGWGFKMTTGTISGSDDYPFGLVVTTLAGTPFNPTFTAVAPELGFFFSRMGTDEITAMGNRNLVMLGGGLAVDPNSGNAFFRITNLSMNLAVPEPATALGLLAGAGMLVGLVRRRTAR